MEANVRRSDAHPLLRALFRAVQGHGFRAPALLAWREVVGGDINP
jgi:hypothetical protein